MWINISAATAEVLLEFFIFALLCLTVYQGFQLWGKPLILDLLNSFKEHKKNLSSQIDKAHDTCLNIEEELANDKAKLAKIQQKLERWHQGRIEAQQLQSQENMHTLTAIAKKKEVQRENLAHIKLRSLVIPQAIQEAAKELQQKSLGSDSPQLLDELIVSMAKRYNS